MYALYVCTRHKRVFLRLNIKLCDNLSDHMTLSGQCKQLVLLSCTSWFFPNNNLLRYTHTHFTHKRRRLLMDSLNFITFAFAFRPVLSCVQTQQKRTKEKFFFDICRLFFDFLLLSFGMNRPVDLFRVLFDFFRVCLV